jgi:hypothetical protein
MCCTLLILSVEQQFFDDVQKQKCSPQGLYGCCCGTQIMLGKLMTSSDTLSPVLLELQDVSVFVEGFVVPQP